MTVGKTDCIKFQPNCYRYDQYGNCMLCNQGYDLMSAYSCSLRSNSTCQSEQNGVCLVPAQGFVLFNGSAIFAGGSNAVKSSQGIVVQANFGYFVWSDKNTIWPLDLNCLRQVVPSSCMVCAQGYALWKGQCVLLRQNCTNYSSFGLCTKCEVDFHLWAGECHKLYCLVLHPSQYCTLCQPGFILYLGFCRPKFITNC